MFDPELKPLFLFTLLSTLSIPSPASASDPRQFHGLGVWRVGSDAAGGSDAAQGFDEMSVRLAEKRTERRDVLDGFRFYKDGWNISNEHYLASAGFTGAPLFIIAAMWFTGFGLCLLFLCFHRCFCRRHKHEYSRKAYALSLMALVLFTVASVAGCVVLYAGQGKFHDTTTATLSFVVGKADSMVDHLRAVSDTLKAAAEIGVDVFVLPQTVRNSMAEANAEIKDSTIELEADTRKNSRDIKRILNAVRLALIILAAVMLFLTVLGFFLSMLGLQLLANILVIIGWILVAGTLALCGIFIVLQNVVTDTCVAMDDWVERPVAHTALDDILPCVDKATAQDTLYQSKSVTYQLVGMINHFIANVSNVDYPPISTPFYYNQSGPPVPALCNPFNPDTSIRDCTGDELTFSNAPQVWSGYVCQVSPEDLCTTIGRLTPSLYTQITKAANVSHTLNLNTPFLGNLQDCKFVRDAFKDIHIDHCPGLMQYSKVVYIGLAIISASVMLSLLLWVTHARERRRRRRHRADTNPATGSAASHLQDVSPQQMRAREDAA